MTPAIGIPSAADSLLATWSHINHRVDEIAARVAYGNVADGDFAPAVVELKSLRLQGRAAGVVFHTLDELAGELLSRPRR
jgi:hypothetical protein